MDKTKALENIYHNLLEAEHSLSRKRLIYDAQIKELAYTTVSEALEDSLDDFELVCDRIRSEYNDFFSQNELKSSLELRTKFCSFAAEYLADRGILPPEAESFDTLFDRDIRIACFSNRASDKAYKVFSEHIPRARQVICDSIAALCEEVADGRCELGMLPIYSSADGFMQSVYRHTVRYALSPVLSVTMPSDGDIYVRYLLFSATPCKREQASTMVLTVASGGNDMALLPAALSAYGALLEDVTSPLVSAYEGEIAYRFTFSVKNADMMKIRLFLQINFPSFVINGIYEKIEGENI